MPILEVLVFRGTGGVYNREPPYYKEEALVRAGHYGILGLFDDGQIIGFHL